MARKKKKQPLVHMGEMISSQSYFSYNPLLERDSRANRRFSVGLSTSLAINLLFFASAAALANRVSIADPDGPPSWDRDHSTPTILSFEEPRTRPVPTPRVEPRHESQVVNHTTAVATATAAAATEPAHTATTHTASAAAASAAPAPASHAAMAAPAPAPVQHSAPAVASAPRHPAPNVLPDPENMAAAATVAPLNAHTAAAADPTSVAARPTTVTGGDPTAIAPQIATQASAATFQPNTSMVPLAPHAVGMTRALRPLSAKSPTPLAANGAFAPTTQNEPAATAAQTAAGVAASATARGMDPSVPSAANDLAIRPSASGEPGGIQAGGPHAPAMRPGLPGRFTLRGPRGMAGKLEGLAAGSPLGIDGGMASSSAAGDTMAGNQTARLNGAVLAGAGLGRDGVAAAHNAPEGTVIAVQSRPDGGAIGSPDTLAGPRGRQIATGPGEGMLPGKVGAPSTENGIGVDTAGHAPSGSPTARQNHSAGEQDAPNAGAFKAPDDSDSAPKTSGEKIRPTAVHIDGPGVSGPGATIGRSENARPLKIVKPEIPDNLRSEALHVHVIARVTIHKDNTSDVTLTEPSGNDRIDQVVLRALRAWKWQAAFDSTGPREQTVEEKIDLSVE